MTDTVAIFYRRVLWSVLAINAAMFLVEIGAGLKMLVIHDDAVREYAPGMSLKTRRCSSFTEGTAS